MTSSVHGGKNSYNPFSSRPPVRQKTSFVKKFFSFIWRMVVRFFRMRGVVKKMVLAGIFLAILGFIFLGLAMAYYSFNLPDPNRLAERAPVESTKILDRNGKQLYELYDEKKRTLIQLDQMPEFAKQATTAI